MALIASVAGIVMGVVLPIAVLAGLGWLWLWERGYALIWVVVTLAMTGIGLLISFLTLRWLEAYQSPIAQEVEDDGEGATSGAAFYAPREQRAWDAVEKIAEDADPETLTTKDAVLALGVRTVETVASHIHPDTPDAVWRFTVPEALALIERVSGKLRPMIADNVPFGDQLSVGQVLRIYRWRSAIDLANRAYDIWRIVRFMNPLAAATQEVRERLTKSMYASVREELAKRIAAAYVREVGRAAIDLYSGRLKVEGKSLDSHVTVATSSDHKTLDAPSEPIRILLAGQTGSGKSSLVNAMAGEVHVAADTLPTESGFQPVRIAREGMPDMILIDAPGLSYDDRSLTTLAEKAASADIVIWTAGANRADRDLDRRGLAMLDAYFDKRTDLRPPPRLLALSHVDVLRPQRDWSPPYDLADTENAKAVTIAAALEAATDDLSFSAGRRNSGVSCRSARALQCRSHMGQNC